MGRPVGTTRANGYDVSGGRRAGEHVKKWPTCSRPGCNMPAMMAIWPTTLAGTPLDGECRVHVAERDAPALALLEAEEEREFYAMPLRELEGMLNRPLYPEEQQLRRKALKETRDLAGGHRDA